MILVTFSLKLLPPSCHILVYADASDSCNTLDFQLGQTGIGTTIPTRQWNIKVSANIYSRVKQLGTYTSGYNLVNEINPSCDRQFTRECISRIFAICEFKALQSDTFQYSCFRSVRFPVSTPTRHPLVARSTSMDQPAPPQSTRSTMQMASNLQTKDKQFASGKTQSITAESKGFQQRSNTFSKQLGMIPIIMAQGQNQVLVIYRLQVVDVFGLMFFLKYILLIFRTNTSADIMTKTPMAETDHKCITQHCQESILLRFLTTF